MAEQYLRRVGENAIDNNDVAFTLRVLLII
jgi:hypothetical protein